MPFINNRCINRYGGGCRVFLPELTEKIKHTKNGDVRELSVSRVDQSKDLPDFELFDLKNQLKAGVPLKQVQTKMFGSSEVHFPSDFLESKVEEKITEGESIPKANEQAV